ncbi:MAG: arsenite S-adenosylmethyltransferase [Chloroflexi bacterium]|nr:MAG: arsenite S-adenosylmethyltransferase [Chloroflexota bacterium]
MQAKEDEIRKVVREGYAKIAKQGSSCCGPVTSCCGGTDLTEDISKKIGYTDEEIKAVPEGANLGLGCGNPVALASLREGETVLDLGAGAGFDCFLAADRVGENGKVIGVDMTPEMIEKARENVKKGNYGNVEFRLGEIENLPVADNSVDVVISNCVINLASDKGRVFREAYRVLKPGGRLMVSDIVLLKELPDFIKNSIAAYIGCVSGAILKDEYIASIETAGFQEIRIVDEISAKWVADDTIAKEFTESLGIPSEELRGIATSIISVNVHGVKPI